MIEPSLLEEYKAEILDLDKAEVIFDYGSKGQFYYQVKSGQVKMNNFNSDGREFIQGIFYSGDSFGESPLFADVYYPANAETITQAEIYRLPKSDFFDILTKYPETQFKVNEVLAYRYHYKSVIASEISIQETDNCIISLLDYSKKFIHKKKPEEQFRVDYTRQQIAGLTGRRVETVIRACKNLQKEGKIRIQSRKIYR